ncbi:MAG: hypothetical protein RSA10_03560 [Bacilli bacterium]
MINFVFKYWLQIFFGFLISLFSLLIKRVEKYKQKVDKMEVGIQVILKTKIIESYDKIIQNNCITMYEKELITDLYDTYKSLGGNGFIDGLMGEIEQVIVKINCNPDD